MRRHIHTLRDPSASVEDKILASALLWEEAHKALKAVKTFKESLASLVPEGESIILRGAEGSSAEVTSIPSAPVLEGQEKEDLIAILGDKVYERYIAESRTLRFSLYRNAPREIRGLFKDLPMVPSKHQVKFHK